MTPPEPKLLSGEGLKQAVERLHELIGHEGYTSDSFYFKQLLSHIAALEQDKKRLDWLEKTKAEHYAHWGDGLWCNPEVYWELGHTVKDGTYTFPDELKSLTLRLAIDAAMKKEGGG